MTSQISNPIRILQVVTYMGRGGLETMIMNYYRHVDRSKIQFDFLVHREFRADYDDEIEALGGKIYRLPRLVPWSGSYRRALNAFFAQHPQYRIVHVHQDCLSSVILKAAKAHGVPVRIAHSHTSNQDKNWKYPVKLFYRHRIPRYATALFACGEDAGDWMFGGAPYQILRNAIDVRAYDVPARDAQAVRESLHIAPNAFVVGHVGRFRSQKNHTFLLDAFSELKKLHTNSVLLLVGDGDLQPEIMRKAQQLGLAGDVIFAGVQGDIPQLLAAMDCFVFPSLYEGLGIAAVEAQAAGLPCILSDQVPTQCDLTPLAQHLPLEEGAAAWAQKIIQWIGRPHADYRRDLTRAGYDIEANALWLQNYYLEQWR